MSVEDVTELCLMAGLLYNPELSLLLLDFDFPLNHTFSHMAFQGERAALILKNVHHVFNSCHKEVRL